MATGASGTRNLTNEQASERGVVGRVSVVMSLADGDKSQLAQALSKCLADRSPKVRAAALDVVRLEGLREMNEQVLNLLSTRAASSGTLRSSVSAFSMRVRLFEPHGSIPSCETLFLWSESKRLKAWLRSEIRMLFL